jgi:flagellar protein FliL
MADQSNAPEAQGAEGAGEKEKPAKKGLNIFLLGMLAASLLPSGLGAWLAYSSYERFAVVAAAAGMGFGTEDAEEPEEETTEYGEFMQLENMVINPAGSTGKRFLIVSIGLESHTPATLEELKTKEVVVRDTVLKVLGVRTAEELASIERRTELKDEIREAVNAVVKEGEVDRMYFTQFVLQ